MNRLVILLLGVPFLAIGLGMTGCQINRIRDWNNVKSWQEIPATILTTDLHSVRRKNTVSFEAKATYQYQFQDQLYQSERVSLFPGSDNLGDFQRRTFATLDKHRRSGQMISCYVNPQRPAEAVIFPDLRFEVMLFYSMFGLLFGSVGVSFLTYAFFHDRDSRRLSGGLAPFAVLGRSSADKPGLAGSPQQIVSRRSTFVQLLPLVTGYWLLAATPTSWVLLSHWDFNSVLCYLALIPPVVGGFLVILTAYYVSTNLKYGPSQLQLAASPGLIGGTIAGVVVVGRQLELSHGIEFILSCKFPATQQTPDRLLWETRQLVNVDLLAKDQSQTAIPFEITIPFDAISETEALNQNRLRWELDVGSRQPGADYRAKFIVPVLRTDQSDSSLTSCRLKHLQQPQQLLAASADNHLELKLRSAGYQVETISGGGITCRTPLIRWSVGNLILSSAVIIGLISCLMLLFGMGGILGGVLAAFAGTITLIAFAFWIEALGWNGRLILRAGQLLHESGVFSFRVKRQFHLSQVTGVETKSNLAINDTKYFDVYLVVEGDQRLKIAKDLPATVAQEVRQVMEELLQDQRG